MNSMLIVAIIIIVGFIMGGLSNKANLPKVTGYIVAGILLNPRIVNFIPRSFVEHTDLITHLSLSVITFAIGGTLLISKIKNWAGVLLNHSQPLHRSDGLSMAPNLVDFRKTKHNILKPQ